MNKILLPDAELKLGENEIGPRVSASCASQTAQAVTLRSHTMLPIDLSYQPRALATTPNRKSTMANDGKTV